MANGSILIAWPVRPVSLGAAPVEMPLSVIRVSIRPRLVSSAKEASITKPYFAHFPPILRF